MKRLLFVVLICFVIIPNIIPNYTIAQRYDKFSFEVIGGINYSNFRGNLYLEEESIPGLTIGGGFTYRFSRLLAYHSDVLYSKKQWKKEDGLKRIINYLEIPLLLQFMFPISNSNQYIIHTNIYLGPYISLFIDYTNEYAREPLSIFEEPKDVDYGILIGGGLGVPIDNYTIWVDVRYQLGLGEIWDQNYGGGFNLWGDNKLNSLVILMKFGFNYISKND